MGRMRGPTPVSPYEVNCTRCRVSFPVGTRSCLHCGQPIGRATPAAAVLARRPEATGEDEDPQDFPVRGLKASPMTIVWLVAGAAMVAYRACTSQ
jgi:hypothetical protein